MATSILTDCSSFQGSSSSSDMMTGTTAASSWCAIPTSTRIRMVRLFRPHTRRMLVTPGATPSYGFAVRGGKEYSTGFFVSNVDRNSEAEQKGLRIGDQILRINGFRIDDAIHKEFCQLVTSQDRLVLKVRSVGMLPTKDKENDGLSWNVVKAPSISSTPSECSFQSSASTEHSSIRHRNETVINIVLNVAPRTKLGLGICKGPEWKPGIFVQFTKEKSVAREAGLRPGDQILTVNSIDFSDVLFSEAVAVMKSSTKLDMTVHKGAGCDLFPGESSGYNSSASSVTGDQSPCWADVKSKRLTSVREEASVAPPPPPQSSTMAKPNVWNQTLYENEPRTRSKSNAERSAKPLMADSTHAARPPATSAQASKSHKEINKTIIKLSESGTSINNTFVANTQHSTTDTIRRIGGPKDASSDYNAATLTKTNQPCPNNSSVTPPPPPPLAIPDPAPTQTVQNSSSSHLAHNESNIRLGGLASTMQRYATMNNYVAINELSPPHIHTQTSESRETVPIQNDGSSLSSAITEELKKRKAKRQPNPNYQPSQRSDVLNNNLNILMSTNSGGAPSEQKSPKSQTTLIGTGDQHSALMNEFKQAHKRMFKNGFKESEPGECKDRQEALNRTRMMDDPASYRAKGIKENKFDATLNNNDPTSQQEDINSQIPKPPVNMAMPMQLLGNNNFKSQPSQNNATINTQTPYTNDQYVALRSSNGGQASDMQFRNSNRNSTMANVNPSSNNRQTLRLGTVTIGEYSNHNTRREPEKFDFIASNTKGNDSGATTPTNETLHSELHNTLSRSKLKKTNSSTALEHQRNCPLHQQQQQHSQQQRPHQHHQQHHHHHHHHQQPQYDYQNVNFNTNNNSSFSVSEMTKKLQKTSMNGGGAPSSYTSTSNGNGSNNGPTTGVGILKNGNRNSLSNSSNGKSTEKTIKFG